MSLVLVDLEKNLKNVVLKKGVTSSDGVGYEKNHAKHECIVCVVN